jgi:hypothetical protein
LRLWENVRQITFNLSRSLVQEARQFGRAHVLLSYCSPNLTSIILTIACTFWWRKEVPAEISPGTSLLKNGTSAAAACYVKALPRSGLNNVINLHAAASPTFTHSPIQARRNRWLYFFPPAICSENLLAWISLLDLWIAFLVPVCV